PLIGKLPINLLPPFMTILSIILFPYLPVFEPFSAPLCDAEDWPAVPHPVFLCDQALTLMNY
ncbi:MAG: hypothetical protein VXZ78_06780, partial [Pseudomonadota bacterium]|nr:hypothetical protein [Pseudomonadota bacterium]